ncbi:DNA alkylation repair protein [Gracilibacillus kekensis]|uniref:DNA-3-methylpurine glycosylase n=1 Tax=Gracilibacillus kekensis TaxID=1027249 RepID=A0A1M7NN22_9BACI|nr:DNA alkylation repair protein [Gracilibacillus kekensis]SHN05172.1 DNA-3-methylpurine glycosylase [Gracilibacillus kekensis]
MGNYIPLKYYFDKQLAIRLSTLIKEHDSQFDATTFIYKVEQEVEGKKLKARVEVIADQLAIHLPYAYLSAVTILINTLGEENPTEQGMFTNGYHLMPVAKFVEKYGLEDFDLSMQALYEITKRHTSEYAIRPYLQSDMEKSLHYLHKWMKDENAHVRRLVSEGTRPRLPWAKKIAPLKNDPQNNLSLLEGLWKDSSPYVQKSVANHINDLTKDSPEIVLLWLKEECRIQGSNKVIRHGLRTLIKQKDSEALRLLSSIN